MRRSQLHPRKSFAVAIAATVALSPGAAWGHGGESHGHWNRWNADFLTIACLALLTLVYGTGLLRLWHSSGSFRGVGRWQAVAFLASIVALVAALLSPIDPASDELQSAHMIQHMLIMTVAAPLFILGAPAVVMLWAAPAGARKAVGQSLGRLGRWRPPWYPLWQPILLCVLFAIVLWIWHLPALYEAALRSRPVHEVQHISFFVAACFFWRVLLDPLSRLRMNVGIGVIYLFLTSLHATLLGVFMTLSPAVWYADYLPRTAIWNLSPLEDQQLAGLIMWMPACLIYAVVAAVVLAVGLRRLNEPGAEDSFIAGAASTGGQ